jgi:colanic acid/amylovoran biosynthesis glycosyltransferase
MTSCHPCRLDKRGKLAIVVPHSGQPTETFIRRYAELLDPGNVVTVYFYHGADSWSLDTPNYFPEYAFGGSRLLSRSWRVVQKLVGIESLFGDPLMAASLKSFFLKNHVSTVFSQYLIAGAMVHEVVSSMGLKHVVRGHGFDVSSALESPKWKQRFQVLDSADAIVVPTEFQKSRLRSIGLERVAIHAMPCGVDLPPIRQENPKSLGEPVHVVAAGRMVAKKAPLLSIQAFLKALDSYPNMVLTMIGDGPLMTDARKLCDQHHQGKKVFFTGALHHDQTLAFIAKSDIFMQHSLTDPMTGDQEGAPVAILEAMARSLPVISTRHSGIPHLVLDGVTGLLSDEWDVDAMSSNLVLLATDHEMCFRMGSAARNHVQKFSWDKELGALQSLLGISAITN